MLYAICTVPVCPMRTGAGHRFEMSSQLLLGEYGEVLDETKDFVRIALAHDGYEGWCQRSQLILTETLPEQIGQQIYTADWINTVYINDVPTHVPMGTPLIAAAGSEFQLGYLRFRYDHNNIVAVTDQVPTAEQVSSLSKKFLNTAYLWGGRSVFGIDCSGFAQMVYRFFNVTLLRDAYLQATQGEVVGFLQEARCGDLAFFDNEEGRITHVGIILNDHEIIHASGKVRIDPIDNAGIINADTRQRTHQLRIIKRII